MLHVYIFRRRYTYSWGFQIQKFSFGVLNSCVGTSVIVCIFYCNASKKNIDKRDSSMQTNRFGGEILIIMRSTEQIQIFQSIHFVLNSL